jgi:DNA-binding response OmpR family regulator
LARILIVEDNDWIRWTLAGLLQLNGYDVDQAVDGQQALRHFADRPTDVVLMELHLPVADGLETCQRLRESSQVPILMISAYSDPTLQECILDCGADGFIPKPLEFNDLLVQVRALSASGGDSTPNARRGPQSRPGPPRPPGGLQAAGRGARSYVFAWRCALGWRV